MSTTPLETLKDELHYQKLTAKENDDPDRAAKFEAQLSAIEDLESLLTYALKEVEAAWDSEGISYGPAHATTILQAEIDRRKGPTP